MKFGGIGGLDDMFPTLVHLTQARAEKTPDDTAYIFLEDGEGRERRITYAQLDGKARGVAGELLRRGMRGERALLLFPPGLEYIGAFVGCLYAEVVAVPAYPPLGQRGAERLSSIVADAGARVALTTKDLLPAVRAALPAPLSWIATDAAEAGTPSTVSGRRAGPDTVAFLQYTSGSTRTPRGVILTHANLMHNLEMMRRCFVRGSEEAVVSWLPPYHDMGLIGAILEPLYGGFPAVLMSPLHFLQRPLRWLRAISTYRATISPAPNFAYDLCVRKIDDAQRAALELSSWRAAINGAEPVRVHTVDRFTRRFEGVGFAPDAFRPSYGLAEATLLVSADPVGEPARRVSVDGVPMICCGTAQGGQELVVVDTVSLAPAEPGRIGEIWVSGRSVAAGYWGRPTETAALFHAMLPDGRGPFLRTGDLGMLDEQGLVTITGRLKDLIILNGRNIYPHDVELAVEESHPALRPGCGAAFTVPVAGEERLVVVFEVAETVDLDAVIKAGRRAVAEQCEADLYELVLIEARTIPKTSSGKIQRSATRAAYLSEILTPVGGWRAEQGTGVDDYVAPRTPLEVLIADIWAELLGVDKVGVHEEFLESGAQSLLLTQLATRIEAELPVRVAAGDIFEASTIAGLADLLERRPLIVDEHRLAGLIAPRENTEPKEARKRDG
jgi:acyl-CoA synthetase (AMP-forming)/AMP-acid ligase II